MSLAADYATIAALAEQVATKARALADAEEARDRDLQGFRPGSAARRAANVMLDCRDQWLSRATIAGVSGCQPNAVSVVADRLRTNGLIVQRQVIGGEAHYRVEESR